MTIEYPVGKYTDKIKEILGAETEVQDWLHIACVYDFEERVNIVIYVWDTREIREVLTFPFKNNERKIRQIEWYFTGIRNNEQPKALDNLKPLDFNPTCKPTNANVKKAVKLINQMFEQIEFNEKVDIRKALEVIKYGHSEWARNKYAFTLLKTKKVQEFIENELNLKYDGDLKAYVKEVTKKLAEW